MSRSPEHSKMLVAAGRAALRPLGFVQKGSSRLFYSDEGYWSCIVEFQPSAYEAGSYLNVGAHWLWTQEDYISFDFGGGADGSSRVHGFESAADPAAFAAKAEGLAHQAATACQSLRAALPDIGCIAAQLLKKEQSSSAPPSWNAYHAAIALGLAGQSADAAAMFGSLIAQPVHAPWAGLRQADAQRLLALVADQQEFARVLHQRVNATRLRLKLSPLADGVL
jgi:hypothetical protein